MIRFESMPFKNARAVIQRATGLWMMIDCLCRNDQVLPEWLLSATLRVTGEPVISTVLVSRAFNSPEYAEGVRVLVRASSLAVS